MYALSGGTIPTPELLELLPTDPSVKFLFRKIIGLPYGNRDFADNLPCNMRTRSPFAEVEDERLRAGIILVREHTRQAGCFRVYFDSESIFDQA